MVDGFSQTNMQRIIFENSIKHLNVEILDCDVTADILLASE